MLKIPKEWPFFKPPCAGMTSMWRGSPAMLRVVVDKNHVDIDKLDDAHCFESVGI